MNKYYSYKTFLKRKKLKTRNFLLSIFIPVIIIISIIVIVKNNQISLFSNFLKIKKFLIHFNNTTIPDNLIYQELESIIGQNKLRSYQIINELKNKFPEIQKVKLENIFGDCIKIKVFSVVPIWYCKNKDDIKFFSYNRGWYKVYDEKKMSYNNLIEVQYDRWKPQSLQLIEKIYKKFQDIKEERKLTKIYIKENLECKIYMINEGNEYQIVIDNNLDYLSNEIFNKIIKVCFEKKVNVYARLAHQGKIFIE